MNFQCITRKYFTFKSIIRQLAKRQQKWGTNSFYSYEVMTIDFIDCKFN